MSKPDLKVIKADPKRRVLPWDDEQLTDEALAAEWESRLTEMQGTPKPRIHRKRTLKHLDYIFSPEELRDMGADLAEAVRDKNLAEAEIASFRKSKKPIIEAAEERASELARLINVGSDERPVECEEAINYDDGLVTITRLDTGEEIGTRPLNPEERQMEML